MNIGIVKPRSAGLDFCNEVLRSGHLLTIITINTADVPRKWRIFQRQFATVADATRELAGGTLDAIIPGCEEAIGDANDIAQALALPHNDPDTADARTNKWAMFSRLKEAGIRVPETFKVTRPLSLTHAPKWNYPVIVKPANSSGSDSVVCVNTTQELRGRVNRLLDSRNRLGRINECAIVQEHLAGQMIIVNTITQNGVHLLSGVYIKNIIYWGRQPISDSMILCKELDSELASAVMYVFDCLDALGICHGAAHSELIMTSDGPCLVEVNSRLMGPEQPAGIYFPVLGYSQASLLLESVVDTEAFLRRLSSKYQFNTTVGHCQLRPHAEGTITAMPGVDLVRKQKGFCRFSRLPEVGHRVKDRSLTVGASGIAYFAHGSLEIVRSSIEYTTQLSRSEHLFAIE